VRKRAAIAEQLLRVGRPVDEPVAFIERASTPTERRVFSTLGQVAAGETEVENPAVWVVGEVVAVSRSAEKLLRRSSAN
jgi:uroporphyrin-III C-methyltransferase